MASNSTKGIVLVASSAIVWSTGGLIVRLIEHADNWTIVFWRSATAVLFLVIYLAARDGRRALGQFARMGWPGVSVGLCFCCASISLVVALKLTTVANVLIIMSSSPLIAAGLGRVVLREPVSSTSLLAILGTALGILLIVWQSLGTDASAALLGNLFALVIAFAYAVAIVLIRRHPDIQMTPAVLLGMVMAAIAVAPVAAPCERHAPGCRPAVRVRRSQPRAGAGLAGGRGAAHLGHPERAPEHARTDRRTALGVVLPRRAARRPDARRRRHRSGLASLAYTF